MKSIMVIFWFWPNISFNALLFNMQPNVYSIYCYLSNIMSLNLNYHLCSEIHFCNDRT